MLRNKKLQRCNAHISIPIHERSESQRLGKIGSCPGIPEIYHSHAKKAIQEIPASMRSAMAPPEDQWKARFVSFKTATIKKDPANMRIDPTMSILAKER